MARSSVPTLLPLDQWAEILGMNPWVFNQFDNLKLQGKQDQCQSVWFQKSWNGKYLSRDEIAFNIAAAENLIAEYTHIWVAPKYIEGERITMRQPRAEVPRSLYGVTGRWKQANLEYLRVQTPGKQIWELLDTVVVTLDVSDVAKVNEPFSISFANTNSIALSELRLAFSEDVYNGEEFDETWVIRPVKATESAGVVTFKGPKYLLADPLQQNVINAVALDPLTIDSYVNTVDIYRVYVDTTHTDANPAQGVAIWEVGPAWWGSWCEPDCGVYTAPLCLQAHDADSGVVRVQVTPENWPLFPWAGSRGPDQMQVNYVAGLPLVNQKVQGLWADVVTKLAVSMLPAEDCGCARHNGILKFWRMLPSEGSETSRPLTIKEIENPFGPRRGARYAWERVQPYNLDVYVD